MLNENIKRLRTANNITQVELAADLGVSKQCVSNWENDYIQPSIEMLIKIAKYFKVSTDFLLDLNDKNQINVDGLSDKEIAHIRLIIEDLHNKK
ncbi:MAG: helix-turn-helix domain-containing protein [Clostridiales bacterium]|nr:helix-turn-helix domain-containing protein [Clostridiales bacterium]